MNTDVFHRPLNSLLFTVFAVAVFFEPQYVQDCLPAVDRFFFVGKLLVLVYLVFLGFLRYRFSLAFVLIAALELLLVLNTYIQDGATFSMVKIAIDTLALFLLIDFGLKCSAHNILNALSIVFIAIFGISMVTSIMHPEGLYIASFTTRIEELNATRFFLGNKNQALVIGMAGIAGCYMRDVYVKGALGSVSVLASVMMLVSVYVQKSTTSMLILLGLIMAVGIICLCHIRRLNPFVLMGSVVAADVAVVGLQVQVYFANFLSRLGKDISLTHRTAIWDLASDVISRAPVLGYGLEDSAVTALRFSGYGSPHNFYYAQMYYGGGIALAIIACVFFHAAHRLHRCPGIVASLLSCVLFFMLLQGIFESFSVGLVRFAVVLALANNVALIDAGQQSLQKRD